MKRLDTIEILQRLVSFATVSRDSNLPLIDWVRNYLNDFGIGSQLVHDESGNKAHLIASVGPAVERGVVLSGHSDVVPIDDQDWNSDPFVLTEKDARLYARGSCDMKGFIACALARVPEWSSARLERPVHLVLSYDEELACRGTPSLIAAVKRLLPQPAAVIVGEPTSMRLANRHKGLCALHTTVQGIEAHSSLTHQGVSAIMLAGELIARLGGIAQELAAGVSSRDTGFEPGYTSLSVNRIQGGTANNILAGKCDFHWDIRTLPGESVHQILEQVSTFAADRLSSLLKDGKQCAIQTSIAADVPPLQPDGGTAEQLVRVILSREAPIAVPFGTEAGYFQGEGWSTVVCGPGNIEQAHKPDEFIDRSQLAACEKFLSRAVGIQCRDQGVAAI